MHPLELLYARLTGESPDYDHSWLPLIMGDINILDADISTTTIGRAVIQLVKSRHTNKAEIIICNGDMGAIFNSDTFLCLSDGKILLDYLEGALDDVISTDLAGVLASKIPYAAATEFPISPRPYSLPDKRV